LNERIELSVMDLTTSNRIRTIDVQTEAHHRQAGAKTQATRESKESSLGVTTIKLRARSGLFFSFAWLVR
jgi:hypothetical protein